MGKPRWYYQEPDRLHHDQEEMAFVASKSAYCGSDHQLLTARMKLKLKVLKGNATPARYNVEKIPAQFKVEVKNKFQLLLSETEDEQTPNELWEHMKDTVQSAVKKYISGKRKR